jgi:glycosyltransferase involved in cell wall biosynthesis
VNIVYLSGFMIPSRRAHSIHVMRMCQALARNGHQVTLFAHGHKGRNPTDDIYGDYGVDPNFAMKLIPCIQVRGGSLLSLVRLYRELRTYHPSKTLVYARNPYGASLAAEMGFRVVYEAHCPPPHILLRCLETKLFQTPGFQKLIVISNSLKRIYLSTFRRIGRVEVCRDAADIPPADGVVDYPWPRTRGGLQIGYAGHLYRGRGIDLIVKCAERLPQHDFHIVGGTERDIEYWRSYESANVHFHGFVRPSLVHVLLSKCDVLLAPYQRGLSLGARDIDTSDWMSPMKVFEYMASKRAIIASDLPVLREVLNEDNSVLVEFGDLGGWISAIKACETPTYRAGLAAAAYEDFVVNYTWKARAAQALSGLE